MKQGYPLVAACAALLLFVAPALAEGPPAPADTPASQPGGVGTVTAWLQRAQVDATNVTVAGEQNEIHWEVVRLCARGGDEASARQLGDLIAVRPHRWYLHEVLAVERARRGDYAAAEQAAAEIKGDAERLSTIMQIIQAQALAKDFAGATALADKLEGGWKARGYAEIAAAHALAGDFAAARAIALSSIIPAQPEKKENASMRDRILAAVAEMQGLAGDLEGARETAGAVKEPMLKTWTETNLDDGKSEAAFRKAWRELPGSDNWSLPPATVLEPGLRSMLFEALAAAVSAKDNDDYERSIASAAGIASRVVDTRPPLRSRDGLPMPARPDPTIMQRGLAYTLIAAVEAARNDANGARAMIMRAIETGQKEVGNDLFAGTCGPILAAMLVKLDNADLAMAYGLKLQRGHVHGYKVARAIGYALAERNDYKALADYTQKLENPTHRAFVCLGVASRLTEAGK